MPAKGKYKRGAKADSVRQRKYNSHPRQKKRRAARNKARRSAIKSGKVSKGSHMDIDHINRRSMKGTRVVHRSKNRARNAPLWRRRRRKK